jgi:hypothetical protein
MATSCERLQAAGQGNFNARLDLRRRGCACCVIPTKVASKKLVAVFARRDV